MKYANGKCNVESFIIKRKISSVKGGIFDRRILLVGLLYTSLRNVNSSEAANTINEQGMGVSDSTPNIEHIGGISVRERVLNDIAEIIHLYPSEKIDLHSSEGESTIHSLIICVTVG